MDEDLRPGAVALGRCLGAVPRELQAKAPASQSDAAASLAAGGGHTWGEALTLFHRDTLLPLRAATPASSSQVVPCQSGKKYTVPYVVYEKTWPCSDYPPDGKVSFNIVASECDGAPCDITWEAKVKDPNCNMQAVIGTNQIDLTWDTSAKSKYDGMTRDELAKLNARGAWAAALAQPVERASV